MPYLVKIGEWYVCRGSLPEGCGVLHLSNDVGRARIYTHERHANKAKDAIVAGRNKRKTKGYGGVYVSTPHYMWDERIVPDDPVKVLEVGIEPK